MHDRFYVTMLNALGIVHTKICTNENYTRYTVHLMQDIMLRSILSLLLTYVHTVVTKYGNNRIYMHCFIGICTF